MLDEQKRLLRLAAISFFGFSFVCILIKPQSLGINDGLSYFGNYKETLLPFAGALLLSAYFISLLIPKLPSSKLFPDRVKQGFGIIAICLVALLLAPSRGGLVIDNLHRLFGTGIFITELSMTYYWWVYAQKDRPLLILLWIEFIMGVASAIYVPAPHGFLLQTQLIFQAAFMASMSKALNFASETHGS